LEQALENISDDGGLALAIEAQRALVAVALELCLRAL